MIHWLNPAALAGLLLLALPILIHLLRTRQAERIPFPTLRFVSPARTAAVRLRLPADWLLLAVRLAIVAAAVTAVAGPVIVTGPRVRAWDARIARAVLVDASPAMSVPDATGKTPLAIAKEAAGAEARSASVVARIDATNVSEGLVRAAGWLSQVPPGRREIVVLSAFTEGSLRESDVTAVPAGVGLRFVRVGWETGTRRLPGVEMFSVAGTPGRTIDTVLSGPQTRVRLTNDAANEGGLIIQGADPKSREVQGLLRTVAAAGAPATSGDEPVVCVFGTEEPQAVTPIGPETPRWVLRTLLRLRNDRDLRQASIGVTGSGPKPSASWTVVASDRDGGPLVEVATEGGRLLMRVGAPPESFVAAAAVRALLLARAGDGSRPDQEIMRTPPETLSAWSRPAGTVGSEAWRSVEHSDARWFWLTALLLLGLEQRLRRLAQLDAIEVPDAA